MIKQIIQAVTCGIGFHKWKNVGDINGVEMPGGRRFTGVMKTCTRCNKTKKDKIYDTEPPEFW